MSLVGGRPSRKRGVRPEKKEQARTGPASSVVSSSTDTARYVAQICAEMARMAKTADLTLLAHFLSMAQAEAEGAPDAEP